MTCWRALRRRWTGDAVYVSGYDLVYPTRPGDRDLAGRRLAARDVVVLDPGPLVADIPAGAGRRRARNGLTWLSLSRARGSRWLTGESEAESVGRVVFERSPSLAGLVVRDGPRGLRRLLARWDSLSTSARRPSWLSTRTALATCTSGRSSRRWRVVRIRCAPLGPPTRPPPSPSRASAPPPPRTANLPLANPPPPAPAPFP